jgi:hypothetical protein
MGCPPSRDARNGGDLAMHGSPTAKPSWDLRDQYSGRGAMARCRAAHATHDRSYHPAGDGSVVQNADYNRRFAFGAFTTPLHTPLPPHHRELAVKWKPRSHP